MIFVALDHPNGAVEVSLSPIRIAGQAALPETHPMTFNVRLVDEIKAVAIAEIIPRRLIRIMRATHRVDVELLHALDVDFHAFNRDRLAAIGIEFMAIDPLEEDPPA